jgi:hypothetical protein
VSIADVNSYGRVVEFSVPTVLVETPDAVVDVDECFEKLKFVRTTLPNMPLTRLVQHRLCEN